MQSEAKRVAVVVSMQVQSSNEQVYESSLRGTFFGCLLVSHSVVVHGNMVTKRRRREMLHDRDAEARNDDVDDVVRRGTLLEICPVYCVLALVSLHGKRQRASQRSDESVMNVVEYETDGRKRKTENKNQEEK